MRTYVHVEGVPGVWFFSLDASNTLAVLGERVALGLPYFRALMRLQEEHSAIHFTSTRTHPGAPAARFEGIWARGELLSFTSTMLASQGLPTPREAPLMHAQGEPIRVGICPPERL